MDFIELHIDRLEEEFIEILTAELAEVGFSSFVQEEQSLQAYIEAENYNENEVIHLQEQYQSLFQFSFATKLIPKENWNATWEENYEPIIIDGKCIVRASFHQIVTQYPYEIVINPKMSFGTGHHETTTLMLTHQLSLSHTNKAVLDAGCGTGILAIMAQKLGASTITAYDIDEWAVENTKENFEINGVEEAEIFQGTVADLKPQQQYGIILANINKNVLLEEIPQYVNHLTPQGFLLLSGFYDIDVEDIENLTTAHHLQRVALLTKNSWTSIVFQKK